MAELKDVARHVTKGKAETILESIQTDGNTLRDYQDSRDFITRSLVRDLEHQKDELTKINIVMRRLVNIIYGMMKNKTEYRPYVLSKDKAI